MNVSANVCGNCANFKPNKGDKFFNCTYAKQGGVKYAMQVRADTRSCEAFAPLSQPPKSVTTAQLKTPKATRSEPRPGGLCPWGRIIMLAAIIIIILLLAWGSYTCYSGRSTPAATPTPKPKPTATIPPILPTTTSFSTPVPTPTPILVFQYNLGKWVTAPPLLLAATSAEKTKKYSAPGPVLAPAGTSFIMVTVTLTNAGSKPIFTSAGDFKIVSKSGLTFPPIQVSFMFYNAYIWEPSVLKPGEITSGIIIYVVPDAVSQLRIQTSTASGIVQWILPW